MISALDNNTIIYYYFNEEKNYKKTIAPLSSNIGKELYVKILNYIYENYDNNKLKINY